MTRLYYILFLLFCVKNISAQLPVLDSSWEEKFVDNFNFSLDTLNVWTPRYSFGPCNNGLEYNSFSNLSITNNALRITAQKLTIPDTCTKGIKYYRSGAVTSKNFYKYGYWEISAKQPFGSLGYWTAAWTFAWGCPNVYDELDFMERFGIQSAVNTSSTGWHSQDPALGNDCQVEKGIISHTNLAPLTLYRKYAMEWDPGKFVMYFEGEPIWEVRDPVHVPSYASETILNFAIDGQVNANTVFPAYYDIDYIKIYQLKTDCNSNFTICNFNPNTYDYKVKKSISIGGSGCTSNISTNHTVALRATDGIEFKEGTTITANGSGWFFADVIPCPQ